MPTAWHIFLSCPSRQEPPRNHPWTHSSQASRWGGSRRQPCTPPRYALDALGVDGVGAARPGACDEPSNESRAPAIGRPRVDQRLIWPWRAEHRRHICFISPRASPPSMPPSLPSAQTPEKTRSASTLFIEFTALL